MTRASLSTKVPGQMALPLTPALSGKHRAALVRRIEVGWQDEAACIGVDPDAFYPEAEVGRAVDPRQVCATCPVARSCLAAALVANEQGVWGGTSEIERDRARRDLDRGVPLSVLLDALTSEPVRRRTA